MKIDRIELENKLLEVIDNVKTKRKTVAQVNDKLAEHGVLQGTFQAIAKGDKDLGRVDLGLLFLITNSLHEVTGDPALSPIIYFTDREIEEAKQYKVENVNIKVVLPFVLQDVIKLETDESYITKISIKKLVEIYHSGLIDYDFNTQRSPKYRRKRGQLLEVADVNLTSVKEICDHILNGTYLPDTITLNAYSDEEEPLTYDPRTKQLAVNVTTTILDGFHRLQGAVRALSIQPSIDMDIQLSVKSYPPEKAKSYFGQINTINRVNEARLRELKLEKFADSIVKDLQTKHDSELKGRITSGTTTSKVAGHLTTSMILSNAIDMNFEIKTRMEEHNLSSYLIKFFNHLFGLFPEEFIINPDKFRDISYINHPMMFYGYVALARKFRDENVQDLMRIKDVIEQIDFSKSNVQLNEILGDSRNRDTNANRRKLMNYFASLSI